MDVFSPFIQFLNVLGEQTVLTIDTFLSLVGALVRQLLAVFIQ